MSDVVKTVRNGHILEVTLDRPKANAIDAKTSQEMGRLFAEFRDDRELRVAILTGGGQRFFSAGWDLVAASEGEAYDSDYGVGGFGGVSELPNFNKPVIAAVNGMAVGGGFEIVLACDLVVAAEHASFFVPEVKVGQLADSASIRLPKRLPTALAMELLMTGRQMPAEEALKWGLINKIVKADKLMDAARALAEDICGSAPLAVQAVKEAARESEDLSVQDAYAEMRAGQRTAYEAMLSSEDAEEGPRAFAEKRDPVWKGK